MSDKLKIKTNTVGDLIDHLLKFDRDTPILTNLSFNHHEVLAECETYLDRFDSDMFELIEGKRLGVIDEETGYLSEYRGKTLILFADGGNGDLDEGWSNEWANKEDQN